ncbi:MAG TPA: LLM class F420-dependent oxidoreductase [Actinobacteria bacterium]|nr:F420-dependent glucose-6-phosphate dehydrogenase [bacterium BMS3Bbin02]HDL42154.1 LLM class F420-dependent oxidoreductase [Actinomycetota bacterium]
MRFGIVFANTGPYADPDTAVAMTQAAEQAGFDSVWTVEHIIWPEEYNSTYPYHPSGKMQGNTTTAIPDSLTWLTWVGANTTTLKLATGILLVPERNPLVLAKAAATLDHLSGGRFELGIGVGWLKEEFEALGVPFERRGARTDEYIAAMRVLWAEDNVSFAGEFTNFSNVTSRPHPVNGAVPIVVGGHTDAAARRAGRLGDGFFPGRGSFDDFVRLKEVMNNAAERAGRDPAEIELSLPMPAGADPRADIEALIDLGVSRLMVPAYLFWGDTPDQSIPAFAERMMAAYVS